MKRLFVIMGILAVLAISLISASGCKNQTCVVASSGTVLGIEATMYDDANPPKVRLGYGRAEIAIVPTNRTADDKTPMKGQGASDSTDVLMYIDIANVFDTSTPLLRQRLAVGKNACNASVGFFKQIDDAAAKEREFKVQK